MGIDKNKLTIRISDSKFNEDISKMSRLAIFNGDAMSKNDFVQQMIRSGLDEYKKTHSDSTESNNINSSITTINTHIVSLKESVDRLIAYLLSKDRTNKSYNDALLLLGSEILGVVLDISLGVPVDKEDIASGFYDDIPEKIKRMILEASK